MSLSTAAEPGGDPSVRANRTFRVREYSEIANAESRAKRRTTARVILWRRRVASLVREKAKDSKTRTRREHVLSRRTRWNSAAVPRPIRRCRRPRARTARDRRRSYRRIEIALSASTSPCRRFVKPTFDRRLRDTELVPAVQLSCYPRRCGRVETSEPETA